MDEDQIVKQENAAAPGDGAQETKGEETPKAETAPVVEETPEEVPGGFHSKISRYFFAAFALAVILLSILLVRPFLAEIFLAFALYIVSRPVYDFIKKVFKGRRVLSSIVACVIIVLIIFIPFIALTGVLATNAYDFYRSVGQELRRGSLQHYLDIRSSVLFPYIAQYVPSLASVEINGAELAATYLGTVSEFIYSHLASVVKGFSSVLIGFVLIIFVTFYLFLDGESFIAELKRLSPFEKRYNEEIIDELVRTIRVTFKGSFVVALVQGALGAVGFLACGIQSWALWGLVMAIASLIPVVGTALIWVPAAVFLAVTGRWWAAGFLVVWGVAAIGLADNLLRPYLLKGESHIHPLLIFFSVMGGLAYFGFLGILLGPLVLSLLVYLLRIYKKFFNPRAGGKTAEAGGSR